MDLLRISIRRVVAHLKGNLRENAGLVWCVLFVFNLPLLIELTFDAKQLVFASEQKLFLKHAWKLLSSSFVISVLLIVLLLPFSKKTFRILCYAALCIAALLSVIAIGHWIKYGFALNSSARLTMLSSHFDESLTFVQADGKWFASLLSIILLVFFILLPRLLNQFLSTRVKGVLDWAGLILGITFMVQFVVFPDWFYWHSTELGKYEKAFAEAKSFQREFSDYQIKGAFPPVQESSSAPIHLVVIGESVSKHHVSLYNYSRQTMPLLASDSSLRILDGAYTDYVHTETSLKEVFFPEVAGERISFVDELKHSGYECIWLSNQEAVGFNEKMATTVAGRCDSAFFLQGAGGGQYDEELFSFLNTKLDRNKPTVFFVHMMGSHQSYRDRYPEAYAQFSDSISSVFGDYAAEQIAHYDNSILYQDHLLYQLLQKKESFSSFIYFSDHGDEVYDYRDFRGHHQGLKSKYMSEVPLLIYHPQLEGGHYQLKDGNLKQVYRWCSSLFGLWEDEWTMTRKKRKRADSTAKERPLAWAHRVNSVARFNELKYSYEGFELDLVWQDDHFDVNHPPAQSIGLSLEKYLAKCDQGTHAYWLDIKNLEIGSISEILSYLKKLDEQYNCKARLILESENQQALHQLYLHGFYTSLYLPSLSNTEVAKEWEGVKSQMDSFPSNAVSQSVDHVIKMQEEFPKMDHLCWALRHEIVDQNDLNLVLKFVEQNGNVKVTLVNHPTKSWR